MNRYWERVMLVLVVCVPVPALALSGLSVPLPSVVERVAAALVPFGDATVLDGGSTLAAGRIVLTADTEAVAAPAGTRAAATEEHETGQADGTARATPAVETPSGDTASTVPRPWTVAGGATLEEHTAAPVPAPDEPEPAATEEPAAPEEPADRDPAPAPAPTPAPTPAPSPGDNRKKLERTPEKEPKKDVEPVTDVVDTTPVPVPEPVVKVDPPAPVDPPRTPPTPVDPVDPVKDAVDAAADLEDSLWP